MGERKKQNKTKKTNNLSSRKENTLNELGNRNVESHEEIQC